MLWYNGAFSFFTAGHELGHAFGLLHDFNDGQNIMSYGPGQSRVSTCHAELLVVHPYFSQGIPIEGYSGTGFRELSEGVTDPHFEIISSREYPAGSSGVHIQLRVSDSDGLHQVILYVRTEETHPAAGSLEVKACRSLDGETDAGVTFNYDGVLPSGGGTSLSNPVRHEIYVRSIDLEGNFRGAYFPLIEISPRVVGTLKLTRDPTSVVYSPDGTMLATGSNGGKVELWDLATQNKIRHIWQRSFCCVFTRR